MTCQTACQALFDCGLEDGGNGQQICPGFDPGDGALFVPGCVQQCMNNMGLIGLVDPSDCEGTIDTVSGINAQFDNFCQNGL